jgi:outer membrane protein assembly factor BamA
MERRASSLLEASSRSKHQYQHLTTLTIHNLTQTAVATYHFNQCTKISLQIDGRVCSTEMEGNEHTATEIIEAFVGLMVGQTFTERTCYKAMNNIAEERYTEDES